MVEGSELITPQALIWGIIGMRNDSTTWDQSLGQRLCLQQSLLKYRQIKQTTDVQDLAQEYKIPLILGRTSSITDASSSSLVSTPQSIDLRQKAVHTCQTSAGPSVDPWGRLILVVYDSASVHLFDVYKWNQVSPRRFRSLVIYDLFSKPVVIVHVIC